MKKKPAAAAAHWSQQREEAAGYWQLHFLLVLFRLLPVVVLRVLAFPVGFFYFLFSRRGRTESRRFLRKAAPLAQDPRVAGQCRSPLGPLRHIISFSLAVVEKLQTWGSRVSLQNVRYHDDDIQELIRELESGKGVVLVFSHLGNAELLRGLLSFGRTRVSRAIPFTAVMDMKVNAHFSRMLKTLNPQSDVDVIGTGDIGPHTMALLEERIAAGGMVVVTGDRNSVDGRTLMLPFLGKEAPFSAGIFYMAALTNAPVYFVFALRRKELSLKLEYDMHVHKSGLSFDCPRRERHQRSALLARSFVALLESYCRAHPFQWYNFFDFWQEGA